MKKLLFAILICFIGGNVYSQELTRILFVLDASNSMNKNWGNQTRFAIAKEVLSNAVDSLRGIPNLELALRVYGHQSLVTPDFQDCDDTKLEIPFAKDNHQIILNKIKTLRAKGTTPIVRSLEQAAGDFPDRTSRNVIILITDGIEACDDEPCVIADKLRAKGITISPFVIGLGLDMSFLEHFDCYGDYKSAEDPMVFRTVMKDVVNKALGNTTSQINLNTIDGKPLETDVSMFLYKAGTRDLVYTYTHTLNEKGLPDTLIISPDNRYDLVVKTLPQQTKNDIEIQRGTHNTIELDAPQGNLKIDFRQNTKYDFVDVRVMQKGSPKTLNHQKSKAVQKYIVGEYDLEILTLPRRYQTVTIEQSRLNTIWVDAPGIIITKAFRPLTGQIFEIKKNNEFEWVCDLDDTTVKNEIVLQPGNYQLVYRRKDFKETSYTRTQEFKIYSNKTLTFNL